MDLNLLGIGANLLLSIFAPEQGPDATDLLFEDADKDKPKIVYKCSKEKWVKEPVIKKSVMKGTITVGCEFEGASDGVGGFTELEPYIHERLKKEALKVHKGPVKLKKKYKKLDNAQFYDATMRFESKDKKERADLRQDAYIATDEKNILHFDTFTTKVSNTKGNFKYFKKVDIQAKIESTNMANLYKIQVEAYFEVKKPWFAPGGFFKRKAKEAVAKQAPKVTKELVEDIAKHM